MTAILKVDTIQDTSGNNIINESSNTITIGKSGDAVNLASGATNNLGITMADQWRLTANITSNGDITSNLERVDNTSYGKIGTGMSQSSGIFTFPSTGLYKINFNMQGFAQADDNVLGYIYTTTNNSSYTADAICYLCGDGSTQGSAGTLAEYFFNVTNTSTHKLQFEVTSIATGGRLQGNTSYSLTNFTFIRLGDSQ